MGPVPSRSVVITVVGEGKMVCCILKIHPQAHRTPQFTELPTCLVVSDGHTAMRSPRP